MIVMIFYLFLQKQQIDSDELGWGSKETRSFTCDTATSVRLNLDTLG
jgi:hypothetical protein